MKMANKIVVLGDLHIGVKKDSPNFIKLQQKFFRWMFYEMSWRGLKKIVQLGDVFDSHSVVHLNALYEFKRCFLELLSDYNVEMITLVGNHDIAHRNSVEVNSIDLVVRDAYPNVTVVSKPVQFGDDILMIPWICKENQEQVAKCVAKSKAKYCFGHFEFKDFYMQSGVKNEHGQDATGYSKFDLVLSGHYHYRNQHGNVLYVGTPYPLTWAEAEDQKGFTILDLDTGEVEFVKSPFNIFKKINLTSMEGFDEIISKETLLERYVKLYISDVNIKPADVDYIKSKIGECGVYDLEVIDLTVTDFNDTPEQMSLEVVELKDSKTILDMYIDSADDKIDKPNLKRLMYSLYTEALQKEGR